MPIAVRMRTMRLALILALTLAACGDDDAPPPNDDLCESGACLTAIDDEADWQAVSEAQAGPRCEFADETKYIAPATATAALQETVYQDVAQHRFHVEFLRTVLSQYFAGLTPEQYATMVQRRATREYWGGAIARIVDVDGNTVGYGFDVIVDQSDVNEGVTEAEVEAIHAILSESFHLPLGYAPRTPWAINDAQGFDLPFTLYLPRACGVAEFCLDPEDSCIDIPADLSMCGQFVDDRPIALEHRRKIQVAIPRGEWALPTDGSVELTLISGGTYGPERTQITAGPGLITWRDDFDLWEYTQTLTAGDETIQIWTQFYAGTLPATVTLAEPHISQGTGFFGTIGDGGDQQDTLPIQSCDFPDLEPWSLRATVGDGDTLHLQFRWMEPFAGSAPLAFQRATVTLGGQEHVVADYFDLVYAGLHHNFDNQWWVLFDQPVSYLGHDIHGLWVDGGTYMPDPVDAIYTLDGNLQALDTLEVVDSSTMRD